MGHVIWASSLSQPGGRLAGAESGVDKAGGLRAGSVPWAPREVASFLNHCQLEVGTGSHACPPTHGSS